MPIMDCCEGVGSIEEHIEEAAWKASNNDARPWEHRLNERGHNIEEYKEEVTWKAPARPWEHRLKERGRNIVLLPFLQLD
jgi:hypothetical protein